MILQEKASPGAIGPKAAAPQLLRRGFLPAVYLIVTAQTVYLAYHFRAYLMDDAYIGMQYLRNLLAGSGFVFHAGQSPVEGVTNIGWLLFLGPFTALVDPVLAAKVISFMLLVISLVLTARLCRRLACGLGTDMGAVGLAAAPLLLVAWSFDYVYFCLAGMETALLAVVAGVMVWVAARRGAWLLLPVLTALAFLIHPEAALAYPIYCLLQLSCPGESRRRLWVGNLVLVALLAALTAMRRLYFGGWLPNTFHSKPSDWFLILAHGYDYVSGRNPNVPFPISGWLGAVVLLVGYLRLRRAAPASANMLGAFTAVGLAFCLYSLPDWTGGGRYFAPYLPAAVVLFWVGVAHTTQLLVGPRVSPLLRKMAVLAAFMLVGFTAQFNGLASMAGMEAYPGYVLAGKNLVAPAKWIRENLPDGCTIATRRIGALAYYSDKQIFDYAFGLPDREVAKVVSANGGAFDSPDDAALAELWRDRKPDYVLEDDTLIERFISASGDREHFAIHGLDYRVMKRFSIGTEAEWVLAERIGRD